MKRTVLQLMIGLVMVCGLQVQPAFAVAPQEIKTTAAPKVEARIAALEQQAVVGTMASLKLVDFAVGLRVTEEQEVQGLDLSQHGEEGYNLEV